MISFILLETSHLRTFFRASCQGFYKAGKQPRLVPRHHPKEGDRGRNLGAERSSAPQFRHFFDRDAQVLINLRITY